MSNDIESDKAVAVDVLSRIIASELAALSSEYWTPRFNADQMDDELKFRRKRISTLRDMRTEFENLMHGLTREDT